MRGKRQVEKAENAPVALDLESEQLRRDGVIQPLRPKTFALLRYLATHPGRVVTKEEILEAVWPDSVVTESQIKDRVLEIRKALGDDPKQPRYIETVPRRGYRLKTPFPRATPRQELEARAWGLGSPAPPPAPPAHASSSAAQHLVLVGREVELARLEQAYARAVQGQRQLVFVTGEPGIGKTTVVDAFVRGVAHVVVSRGQCVEQYGAGEAYLPVLEVMSRLCRGPAGAQVIGLLRQYAPTWLVQLPALVSEADFEGLQRKVAGATKERMLREAADVVEILTAEVPLIVVLEDLHWSDTATIELLTMLARRREVARVLVIGTYRPTDVVMSSHPLKAAKQELQTHGQCEEIAVSFLTEGTIGQYLATRFPGHTFPSTFAQALRGQTEGNPLFLVNTVNHLEHQGVLREEGGRWRVTGEVAATTTATPENLRQLIERQLERLGEDERRVVEVASVAGAEFSAAVFAVEGLDRQRSEERCEQLARRGQLLQARGEVVWPDGTVAGRYGFLHALYQNVLYEQLSPGRRVRLHQQIGTLLETAYGTQTQEIAAALAVHFEAGRDTKRTVQYRGQAAQVALQRSALTETLAHLEKGLTLLATLPDSSERAQQELTMQLNLGSAALAAKGLGAPEVGHAFSRARGLAQRMDDSPLKFFAFMGVTIFYLARAELRTGLPLAEQCLRLAEEAHDTGMLLAIHQCLGSYRQRLGDFAIANTHYEHALALYDPRRHHGLALQCGFDPGVMASGMSAWALWLSGYPDRALQSAQHACGLATELGHANTQVLVWATLTFCLMLRGEFTAAHVRAEETVALSIEHGVPNFAALGKTCSGWLSVRQGEEQDLAQMRNAVAEYEATGSRSGTAWYLSLLVDACWRTRHIDEGLTVLGDAFAFVEHTDEREDESELWRLKGELLLAQASQGGKGEKPKGRRRKE